MLGYFHFVRELYRKTKQNKTNYWILYQLIKRCFSSWHKIWNKTLLKNSLLALSWAFSSLSEESEDSSLFLVEWIFQCHPPKNYTQFFTWLGLHLLLLSNWYLGKCYSAFCLPFMNRQLEFKINPVKFQECMIAFSFFVLYMLVVTQFIASFILSISIAFPLIFLPLSSVNFHLLDGIQKQWAWVKTSRKWFFPKCLTADAGAMPRQNPAHVALSLPTGREWLNMLVAAFTLPLCPRTPPWRDPATPKKRQGSGVRPGSSSLSFLVHSSNSMAKEQWQSFLPCCGFLFLLTLPARCQSRQDVWGEDKNI